MMTISSATNETAAAILPTIDHVHREYLQHMLNRFYYPLPANVNYHIFQARAIAQIVVNGAITAGYMARPDGTPEAQQRVEFATALMAEFIRQR